MRKGKMSDTGVVKPASDTMSSIMGKSLLSHHWTVQTKRAQLPVSGTPCIHMDDSNKRVDWHVAFCVFDLQIDWFQFGPMTLESHASVCFPSSGTNCRDWLLCSQSLGKLPRLFPTAVHHTAVT